VITKEVSLPEGTYVHKWIPTMTMVILEQTKKGFKCLVTNTEGIGKVRKGKVEYFHTQDIVGEKALFYPAK
jgi:hypothetical protein